MTPIPAKYQPGGTGTTLQWRAYAPNNGPGPWPVVIVVHGGSFQGGSPFKVDIERVAEILAVQGYYALTVCYRLAPCGRIPGQAAHDSSTAGVASGRPPQQTDDIMDYVLAARADSHCNGKVGLIGSSSGGTLTTYVSLYKGTISVNGRPPWNQSGRDDRPDCSVSFSGVYDLSDQIPDDETNDRPFIPGVQNYTNTCSVSIELADSPISLVPGAASAFKPLFMVNTEGDMVVPPRQLFDMECALINAGVSSSLYTALQIPGDDHAIGIWTDADPNTQQTVGQDGLDLLDFWLK